jgi:hypothetical protein
VRGGYWRPVLCLSSAFWPIREELATMSFRHFPAYKDPNAATTVAMSSSEGGEKVKNSCFARTSYHQIAEAVRSENFSLVQPCSALAKKSKVNADKVAVQHRNHPEIASNLFTRVYRRCPKRLVFYRLMKAVLRCQISSHFPLCPTSCPP